MAAGKKIEIVKGSSDASPDSAVSAVRKLVEQDGVKVARRPALRRRGPRGQGLCQDPAERDLRQRHLGRAGHDAARSGAELLPLLDRRRAVDGRPRHLCLQRQGLQEGRHRRRGLFLPLHAGVRLHGRVLQGRRQGAVEVLGADRQQGLFLGHRRHPRRRRRDLCGARRRRRRQLPDPVPAGRRRGAADRRLDHRRPDRAGLQGQVRDVRDRHAVGRPDRRHQRHAGLEGLRRGLQEAARTPSRRRRCSRMATTSTRRRRCWRSTRSAATSPTAAPSCARRCRSCPSTRRPARCRSTRTATPSPTSS